MGRFNPQGRNVLLEQIPGPGIQPGVARQWQVMGAVLAGAVKAEAFDGFSNAVGNLKPSKASAFTAPARTRSEEHTSELQSRPHLVCRLLLEKKKNKLVIVHILNL